MLVALTKKNDYVYANNLSIHTRQPYFCPGCGKRVFYKKGTMMQSHFAHFSKVDCGILSEGETKEHILGKQLLVDWFKNQGIPCQLEAYLPHLKQRPDLLIWLSRERPIAIEFQCSPISQKKMIARTRGYKQAGYEVYWILGRNFQLQKSLKNSQRIFLSHQKDLGLQLYFLKVENKEMQLVFHIREEEPFKHLIYKKFHFSLMKSGHTLDLLQKKLAQEKRIISNKKMNSIQYVRKYEESLHRKRLVGNKELLKFQTYLYQKGKSIHTIPKEAYFPSIRNSLILTPSIHWRYLIVEWLVEFAKVGHFSEKQYIYFLNSLIQKKQLLLYPIPQVPAETRNQYFLMHLTMLAELKLVKKIAPEEWSVLLPPKCE